MLRINLAPRLADPARALVGELERALGDAPVVRSLKYDARVRAAVVAAAPPPSEDRHARHLAIAEAFGRRRRVRKSRFV